MKELRPVEVEHVTPLGHPVRKGGSSACASTHLVILPRSPWDAGDIRNDLVSPAFICKMGEWRGYGKLTQRMKPTALIVLSDILWPGNQLLQLGRATCVIRSKHFLFINFHGVKLMIR